MKVHFCRKYCLSVAYENDRIFELIVNKVCGVYDSFIIALYLFELDIFLNFLNVMKLKKVI